MEGGRGPFQRGLCKFLEAGRSPSYEAEFSYPILSGYHRNVKELSL